MTREEKVQCYEALPDVLKEVYSSDTTMLLNAAIVQKYSLVKVSEYVSLIGSVVLGIYKTNVLPGLLVKEVGVTPDVAKQIVADLKDFMTPVYEREATAAGQKQADLKALHTQLTENPPTPYTPQVIAPTIPNFSGKTVSVPMEETDTPVITPTAETPTSPHNVVPMRTMAADMSRVHGYGAFRDQTPNPDDDEPLIKSSQDTLLQK